MRNKLNKAKFYYMYGKHSVIAALNNPNRHVQNVSCTEQVFKQDSELIGKFNYQIQPANILTKMLNHDQNHQGIIAQVGQIFLDNLSQIDLNQPSYKIAILDQITDAQNVGAIIRSAAAFSIDLIILPSDNSPDENATIAKVASGALEMVKIIKVTNLRATMEYLKKQGFWIIGLDSKGRENINRQLLSSKVVLVLGSEDHGLRPLTKKTCDYLVKIPICRQVESLNVANSAAIAFYLASQPLEAP